MLGAVARATGVPGLAMVVALLFGPITALASTGPDPSLPACALPSSTVTAGVPVELTGTLKLPDERVGIMARADTGEFREGTVAMLDGTWRAVILFGAADGGPWTIEVSVDGTSCVSRVTVVLPAGMVAPPTRAPVLDADLESAPTGIDGGPVMTVAASAGFALFVGSLIVLAAVGVAARSGQNPLARRTLRRLVRGAAFVAVLGGFLGIAFVIYIGWSFRYFGTRIPSGERALLDLGLWAMAIGGAAVATLAARRVPGGSGTPSP